MVKSLIHKIVLVSAVLVCWGCTGEIRAQNVLAEILRRVETNGRAIQLLRADVTMVSYNSALKSSDVAAGAVTYLPKSPKTNKRYFRVDWAKPLYEQFSLTGDDYELYRPKLNQVIAGKIASPENAQVMMHMNLMQMSKQDLVTNYQVIYTGEETLSSGIRTWHLILTPKSAIKIKSLKSTEVWVGAQGMIQQVKATEKNGDSTTIGLTNIENTTLEDIVFKLKYPKAVKKVKA